VARILLKLLLACYLPAGPVLAGIDETLKGCRGRIIAHWGLYREIVRSSGSHFVKSSGLGWMSVKPVFVAEVRATGAR
jgi:hypothetical protein